jgi:phosphatidylinositol 4-kinase
MEYSDDENSNVYPTLQHQHDMDEFDMVQEWRFQPRHPLRRVPFVNKVAESMKGGLKRVSETVRERFERDRTISEELQALTLGECLVPMGENTEVDIHADRQPLLHEYDNTSVENHSGEMQHATSGNSLESMDMGQWGTPQTAQQQKQPTAVDHHPPSKQRHASDMNSIRRRIDRGSVISSHNNGEEVYSGDTYEYEHGQGHNPLLYGSGTGAGVGGSGGGDSSDLDWGVSDTVIENDGSTHGSGPPLPLSTSQQRPPPVVFRESWQAKQDRIRQKSAYGKHPGWKLIPVLVKANDDLRQEQLASQLIYKMASILARERCPVWLNPYQILALTDSGGAIEAIPDTISLDSLKRNDPNFTSLRNFFHVYYGEDTPALANAKANFVESLAGYSMVCFLLQIKDRHNGNILLDSQGHVVHIDFGFFFLSSPGKNAGFESAPFKLTREFVDVLDGPHSHLFHVFRELCVRSFLALRKHCMEIILLVEMLKTGNEECKSEFWEWKNLRTEYVILFVC